TDKFDVQLGGREGWVQEDDGAFTQSGPFIGPVPTIAPPISAQANAFTYLATGRYKIASDIMAYVRLASGYRPGGTKSFRAGVPTQYAPDKTQTYEIGAKGNLFNGALFVDASLFYIGWKDIQVQFRDASANVYQTNGSGAKSQGIELSAATHP